VDATAVGAVVSASGGADGADDVGLATAHSAGDGQHSEAVTGRQAAHDIARLLETDSDLQGKTGCAQTSFVAYEHTAEAVGERVRAVGGTESGGAKAVEAPLMEPLVRQAPRDRLPGPQLFATYRTRLATDPGLNVGKRSGSAARRSHACRKQQPRCQ
jgi:hypothetical protein